MNKLEEILKKYFRDETVLYYITDDIISDNQFIYFNFKNNKRDKVIISLGSDEGRVEVKTFTDADKLEEFIKMIIF